MVAGHMDTPSLPHLHEHHGDFAAFRDLMVETAVTRFGSLWWGLWDQLVAPPCAPTIIDLGTGPGALLPGLRRRHPDARIIGVDVQPVMLDTARQNAEVARAEIVVSDLARPLPFADGVADVVTAVHVVHEVEFPIPFIAEMARILKPGGVVVVYDWVKQPLADYVGDAVLDEYQIQHFREHCLYEPRDLEWMLGRAGFKVRETLTRRGGRYVIIVAEKVGSL